MRIQPNSAFFGAALFLGLGMGLAHAQAPPEARSSEIGDQENDAAARGLRSLYVPGGLTSDRAVEEIVRTSPELKRTRTLVGDAKGGAMQAMSGLVPRVELLGRYSRLSPVDTAGLATGADDPSVIEDLISGLDDPNAQALWTGLVSFNFPSLTQQWASDASLIYSFTDSLAEALPAYRAAQKNKKAAGYQITASENNVAFLGRQSYYEFARAEAQLGVAMSAWEAAKAQREDTDALVRAGAAARVDLLRVEAQAEAAKVVVERAKLALEVAKRSLQALMHTEELPTLGEDLSDPVDGVPMGSEEELKEIAFRDRPDLKALHIYIAATRHQLKAANGGRLPDFLLRGSAQYSNPNLRVVPQQDRFDATWEVSAVVRWAPNDTVEAQGRSKRLQAELERAHTDVIELGDAIRVEVAEGYHGMLAAQAAIESARLGVNAAEESYRVKREQLRAGIVNTTDLLQAQSELIRAQVDVVDSAIGLRVAKAQLLRAIGVRP